MAKKSTLSSIMKAAATLRKRGLSKSQAMKRAWAMRAPKPSRSRKTVTKKRKRRSNPVVRRNKTRRRRSFTLPMAVVIPAVAGPFIPPGPAGWGTPVQSIQNGDWAEAARTAMVSYTFFDPGKPGVTSEGLKWDGGNAIKALLAGAIIHLVASKLGINRMLGRAKIPFLRI